jgi:hypothetical protein
MDRKTLTLPKKYLHKLHGYWLSKVAQSFCKKAWLAMKAFLIPMKMAGYGYSIAGSLAPSKKSHDPKYWCA